MPLVMPLRTAQLPARLSSPGRAVVPVFKPPQEGMRDAARRYRRPAYRAQGGRVLDLIV